MTPFEKILKFHYFLIFPQKEPPTCEKLPPKIKTKSIVDQRAEEGNPTI
jgi:hypothetical protein